jgi:hypothetical protein
MEYNRRKYHNVPDNRKAPGGRNIRFDSAMEARRYDELMLLLRAKKIRNLKLQPEYTLQEAFTTPEGERIRAIRYKADFSYDRYLGDGYWEHVIEDVKGLKTQQYLMKRKMMNEKGFTVTEVQA